MKKCEQVDGASKSEANGNKNTVEMADNKKGNKTMNKNGVGIDRVNAKGDDTTGCDEVWKEFEILTGLVDRMAKPMMFGLDYIKATKEVPEEILAPGLKQVFKAWLCMEPEENLKGYVDAVEFAYRQIHPENRREVRPLPVYGYYMKKIVELPDDEFMAEIVSVFDRWLGGATQEEMDKYMWADAKAA